MLGTVSGRLWVAGQSVNALKTEIATLLTNEVVSESVKGFVADKEYLNKFIVSLAAQWSRVKQGVGIGNPKSLTFDDHFIGLQGDVLGQQGDQTAFVGKSVERAWNQF